MGLLEVPVFSDVDLRPWLCWMEQYFSRKQLTDFEKLHMAHEFIWGEAEWYINSLKPMSSWKEMKETLLLKFGADDDPEKMILKAGSDRCHSALMNDDSEKRQDSRLCSGVIISVESTLKVPCISLEPHKDNISLGYRHSSTLVEKPDRTCCEMTISELARTNKGMWFSKLERFFSTYEDEDKLTLVYYYLEGDVLEWFTREKCRMNFKNWSDFKCRLLSHFCPVTACSSVEVHYKVVSTSSNNSVSETELVKKKITSPNMEEVNEAEVEFTKDSRPDMEQQAGVHREISSSVCVEQPDLFLKKILCSSLVNGKLKEDLHSSKESAGIDDSFEQSDGISCETQPHSLTSEGPKKSLIINLQSHCVRQTFAQNRISRRLSSKKKKGKYPKAWKYKFKSRNFQRLMLRRLGNFKQVSEFLVDVTCKTKQWRFPKAWKFKFRTKNLHREITRVKHLKLVPDYTVSVLNRRMFRMDQTHLHGLLELRGANWQRFKRSQLNCLLDFFWEQKLGSWLQVVIELVHLRWLRWRTFISVASAELQQHPGNVKWNPLSLIFMEFMHKSLLEWYKVTYWRRMRLQHILRMMLKMRLRQTLQTLNQFIFGEGKFQVKHKWRFKQFQVFVLTRIACGITELQPYEFFHGGFPIFLFDPSLGTSLFLRVGVYERILICWLIMDVLILRFDREQKEGSEMLVQELFRIRVLTVLSHLLFQEKYLLLMHLEGTMLHILVQQGQKKQRTSNIWAWPEILQPSVQGAYRYVTSGDDGTVQSRDDGVMSACASDRVTNFRIRHYCTHGLWSGWSFHKGNKVMQQRRRSKMSESWMFKYKEKMETSAAKLVIYSSEDLQECSIVQRYHDLFPKHQKFLFLIQACGQACFHGGSIDRHLLS